MSLGPKSPPKGKSKEEFNWSNGWWDYYPLIEQLAPRRVEWSNSSVIFSPHASQPRILARHFSSSKHFNIPIPSTILSAPDAYDPPTIISVSPDDLWLFAYFPGRGSDGSACLWRRGTEIDTWAIREFWGIAPGAGIVAASWLGTEREWTTDQNAKFTRLPRRGPVTPMSSPTLLLITQDHRATLCYLRHYVSTLKMLSLSLSQADSTTEPRSSSQSEPDDISGLRLCSSAAIGLGYNETSILIATRSHVIPYPASNANTDSFNGMDMSMQIDFDPQNSEYSPHCDEICGEDTSIEMAQLSLTFDGVNMTFSSQPLASLSTSDARISGLQFVCLPAFDRNTKPSIHLVASSLDFSDYSATPQSRIVCYSFTHADEHGNLNWKYEETSSRSFDDVVGFAIASKTHNSSSRNGSIFVGLLSRSGSFLVRNNKEKETPIGTIRMLRLPDLTEDESFEPSPILTSTAKAGREIPIYATVSPNEVLVSSLSSNLYVSQVSVHRLPKSKSLDDATPSMSKGLAAALLSRRTTADFAHVLALPSVSLDNVADIIYHTLKIVESQPKGRLGILTWQALGVALEVYRIRAEQVKDLAEKETLTARWQSAHDQCSLAACNAAFEDCREADGPELSAAWQFTGICSWIISFIERIMKEAMLRSNDPSSKDDSDGVDLFGAYSDESPTSEHSSGDSPYLLHIVHPYALRSLKTALGNVRSFRNRLAALEAKGENSQIAKSVVVDMVNCATVDLDGLEPLLDEFLTHAHSINVEDSMRSLAACEPTKSMHMQLNDNIRKLCDSGVINKSRLYIKPEELIDGFESLTLEKPKRSNEKDVVSKGMLLKRRPYVQCLRCDGQSEVALPLVSTGTASVKWRAWERLWVPACVCGGSWVKGVPMM